VALGKVTLTVMLQFAPGASGVEQGELQLTVLGVPPMQPG
jgi:hypothetical protein